MIKKAYVIDGVHKFVMFNRFARVNRGKIAFHVAKIPSSKLINS